MRVFSVNVVPMNKLGILQPGQLFDRFRIVKQLGEGGMGEVYLALDKNDNRNVALKVIKKGTPNFERMLAWFHREVALYRKIAHPNVVNFVAAGEVDGIHYVALEQIFGVSLRQYLNRKGPCSLRRAFSWTQDLVFAIHAAHQQDVIHRDIKPENIMIDRDKNVKMIDFGLARAEGLPTLEEMTDTERLLKRGRPRDGKLSGDSGIVGTLSYIAPEVLHGKPATKESDVYALGLVFYEMLTGQILIQDTSSAPIIMERHRQVDKMNSFLPRPVSKLAEELEHFVLRMLKADPAERYCSTKEMVEAMRKLEAQYGSELELQGNKNGKMLAQQELVDTHYWQAMNLFAEKNVEKAIDELFSIITFAHSLQGTSRETLIRELDLLFYTLRPKENTADKSPYALPKPALVELLKKILRLYRVVGFPQGARLKMRVFLRKMKEILPKLEFVSLVQTILSEHMGDALLTRTFVKTLEEQNPIIAKDVWLKFVGELILKERLVEAREELEAYTRNFGEDMQADAAYQDLIVLENAFSEEESQVEVIVEQLLNSTATEQSLTTCLSFLDKYPESMTILKCVEKLYKRENRQRKLASIRRQMGVVCFWRGNVKESKKYFVKVLETDERDATAIAYLLEILDESHALGEVPHDHRALQALIARKLGIYSLVRRELERQLTGTARDEELYLQMAELAEGSNNFEDLWQWLLKAGETRLLGSDIEGARHYFELAMKRAIDKERAATTLKKIQGIRKVYSLSELANVGKFKNEPSRYSGIDVLRKRVHDREEP